MTNMTIARGSRAARRFAPLIAWVAAPLLLACGRGETRQVAAESAIASAPAPYPHATEAIGTVRESYDGTLSDSMAVHTFRNIDRLFPTRDIAPSDSPQRTA